MMDLAKVRRFIRCARGNEKGMGLVALILAIILMGILASSMIVMQATEFDVSWRNLRHEQAFAAAESGISWGVNQLFINGKWRTTAALNCTNNASWVMFNLTPGVPRTAFSVCCRNATFQERGNGYGAVVEAKGFVYSNLSNPGDVQALSSQKVPISNYKAVQAYNRLDWSDTFWFAVDGDTQASYYNGDDVSPDNRPGDLGFDYEDYVRIVRPEPYPKVNMYFFETEAASRGEVWSLPRSARIKSILVNSGANLTTIVFDSAIFACSSNRGTRSDFNGQGLRNITKGAWTGTQAVQISNVLSDSSAEISGICPWAVGDRVAVIAKISSVSFEKDSGNKKGKGAKNKKWTKSRSAFIHFDCNMPFDSVEGVRNLSLGAAGTWEHTEWADIIDVSYSKDGTDMEVSFDESVGSPPAWVAGNWVCGFKMFDSRVTNDYLWYVRADVLLDMRDNSFTFKKTNLAAEGDIVIRGGGWLYFTRQTEIFPSLVTKNGNIYSPDTPDWGMWFGGRTFQDLIISENGNVTFNGLYGNAVIGRNVTFGDLVYIDFEDRIVTRIKGIDLGTLERQEQ